MLENSFIIYRGKSEGIYQPIPKFLRHIKEPIKAKMFLKHDLKKKKVTFALHFQYLVYRV